MHLKRHQLARTAFSAVCAVITIFSLGVLVHAQDGERPPDREAAPRRFKNLKVLKGLPPEQVVANMRIYARSLGVRCNFCHVQDAQRQGFERDDKPTKLTARKMIVMVKNLNRREKVLKGKVTCYTCHRGQHVPEPMPPMPMMDNGPRPPQPDGERPAEPGEGGRTESGDRN